MRDRVGLAAVYTGDGDVDRERRKKVKRFVWLLLLVYTATGSHGAKETELPPGVVTGVVVEDDGRALVAVGSERFGPEHGSSLTLLAEEGVETFDLPGFAVTKLIALSDGRILLEGRKGPRTGKGWSFAMEVVAFAVDGSLRRDWDWNSSDYWQPFGMHREYLFDVAGDGLAWGAVGVGEASDFNREGGPKANDLRVESVSVNSESGDAPEWLSPPGLLMLDSEGPVVLAQRDSRGAHVIHLSAEGGVSRVVPILFENERIEHRFKWQSRERVLWARTGLYWRAYHLSDLELPPGEPFWVVEKSVVPHDSRGVVRRVPGERGLRIEHVWRDPLSRREERRVSGWYPGQPEVFVSPNGRHAIAVKRVSSEEGIPKTLASRAALELAQPLPPVQVDVNAENAEDRRQAAAPNDSPVLVSRDAPLRFLLGPAAESAGQRDDQEEP